MQASAREHELLKTLEKSQTSLLRAESSNVHSELEGRQQVISTSAGCDVSI